MDSHTQTIIFDLDGTLLDTYERWYALHTDLAKKYSYDPLSKEEYIANKTNAIDESQIMQKTNILPRNIEQYVNERVALIETKEYLAKDAIKPLALELLLRLKKTYNLVLLTKRKNKEYCSEQLNKLGLTSLFDRIVITESGSKVGALTGPLNQYLNSNTLFIADTVEDMKAAEQVNLKYILVADGARSYEYLLSFQPAILFKSLLDVEEYLKL